MSPGPLSPGSDLQQGRFVIVGVIARGGQAVTFEAVDKRQGRRVAIKRFEVSGATSWKDVELAEREARVLAVLSHESLPQYIEHFEEAGSLYLVMDYVAGPTVEELRISGTLQHADVVRFLREMANTLDYLHGHSPPIIHRDIKPRNVIKRTDGHFTLVDFGSVRDKLRPEGGSTVVGTFGYMAPEQFQGRAMPATDLYATAATAVAMLTGVEPDQLPHQGLRIDVQAALGTTTSPELSRLLQEALDPDPDVRGRRTLTQLLRTHHLLTDESTHQRAPHRPRRVNRDASSRQHAHATAADSSPPFQTNGHRRDRSKKRSQAQTQSSWQGNMPNFEPSVAQALQHQGVRSALRMPLVMTFVILLLVLLRTAVWLFLGVVLPALFSLLHAVLRLPLTQAASESMAMSRALRAQFRQVSRRVRSAGRGHADVGHVSAARETQARNSKRSTRYRIHAEAKGTPDREASGRPQSKPEQLADELEREAEKLELELERNVLAWQNRLSDRK